MDEGDDVELVQRFRNGDGAAFDQLVDRHVQRLRIYLGSRCRSRQVVDEVSQETWVRAFTGLHTYDEKRPFIAWLIGIARNQLADRARQRDTVTLDGDLLDCVVDRGLQELGNSQSDDERLRHLDDCLALMKPRGRDLLVRHHAEGWSLNRLAQAYKLPAKRLAMQLLRLRRNLRQCVERHA